MQIPNDALDHRRGDLQLRQAKDTPALQRRFEILLGILRETLRTIVAALDVDAALDLDERATLDVRKVRAPFSLRVKDEFAFQLRAAEAAPVELKLRFEARGR